VTGGHFSFRHAEKRGGRTILAGRVKTGSTRSSTPEKNWGETEGLNPSLGSESGDVKQQGQGYTKPPAKGGGLGQNSKTKGVDELDTPAPDQDRQHQAVRGAEEVKSSSHIKRKKGKN